MNNEFDIKKAKGSVKDLAAKVKELKGLKRTLRDNIRVKAREGIGTQDDYHILYFGNNYRKILPITIPWHDGTPIGWPGITAKLNARRQCSRSWQLAYAFARGMPYRRVEPNTEDPLKLDLDFSMAPCLAEITSAPGVEPTNPDGSFSYYASKDETRAYLDDLRKRVRTWIAVESEVLSKAA